MLQMTISNLNVADTSFEVPAALGMWEFTRTPNFDEIQDKIEDGMCGNTYLATNMGIGFRTTDNDLETAFDEIIDICLVLSFLNARCVTPTGTTAHSQPQLLIRGDRFITARSIVGFTDISSPGLTTLFSNWMSVIYPAYKQRNLRLQIAHWLSGLTCFSLEDIYTSVSVQMDVIKQVEILAAGRGLHYYAGMSSASARYRMALLGHDYTKMRNDMLHEGRLSGSNFQNKTKAECADVIAATLNWLDLYVLRVLDIETRVTNTPRWRGQQLSAGLPAFSFP